MTAAAPIQLVAVGFEPDARYEGHVISALGDLEGRGSLRVLDVLFVRKGDDGELTALEAQDERFSGVIAAALGLEDAGAAAPVVPALGLAEVEDLGTALEPGQAVGMVLIEHVWAADLMDAVTSTGGRLLTSEFLSDDSLAAIAADLAAREESRAGRPSG